MSSDVLYRRISLVKHIYFKHVNYKYDIMFDVKSLGTLNYIIILMSYAHYGILQGIIIKYKNRHHLTKH